MRVGLSILGLALLLSLAPPAAAQSEPASLPDLEDEVMCPTCGTTLQLSESPQASQIRDQIRRLIAAGLGKEEVKDRLVAEYGREVLAVPDAEGFDLAAWVVPGLGFAGAAAALALAARRWRRGGARVEERSRGPGESDPADQERLDADLDRYRL